MRMFCALKLMTDQFHTVLIYFYIINTNLLFIFNSDILQFWIFLNLFPFSVIHT